MKQLTCDEKAALAVKVEQGLPPLALPVLDHVSFIKDEVLPLLAPKHFSILHHMCYLPLCITYIFVRI